MTGLRRLRSSGHSRALALLIATGLALTTAAGTSLALATDQETVASTLSADTLDPPTNLLCNGLAVCTIAAIDDPVLTWTATPDTYATGYDILRSTTSGSGYTTIASVSGRTTTTHSDTTAAALTTYYYVVRAVVLSWKSVNSNQVQATVLL
jgi:hypothetical protein